MPSDFPDWLSPMLVKELRQGMRSRAFLLSFLALQATLGILSICGLLLAHVGESTSGISAFFWIFIGTPILFIMPFSGLNSISGERRANTLELIFLSRLNARRIVGGKWFAILAQTLLLVAAALPYFILRYFLGGVNLTGELIALGYMLFISALLTGVMIGLSPNTGRFGRALIPIGMIIAIQVLGVFVSARSSFFGGSGVLRGSSLAGLPVLLFLGFLFTLYMLEIAASRIAPRAENHSTSKRLLGLAALLTATLYSAFVHDGAWVWIPSLLIVIPVAVGAVCEPVLELPSIYRPFVRLGAGGRVLGWFFYPGWPSAFFYSLLLFLPPFLEYHRLFDSSGISIQPLIARIAAVSIVGSLLLPVAFFQAFRLKLSRPVLFYMLFHIGCGLLCVLSDLLSTAPSPHTLSDMEVAVILPPCTLLLLGGIGGLEVNDLTHILLGISIVTLLSVLLLLLRMISPWRKILALEKAAVAPESALPAHVSTAPAAP